ncbi:hypothetical protein HDU93_003175 [Gonapodya sp. JEL0774]|nr:hypothetical protein HDU93_003175 [Gonapodya sp. JEL0774]
MTKKENEDESADLYAEFAEIAATKAFAWTYGEKPLTKEEIATVSTRNRMICYPYPLVQNAFNGVNCAAAILICSQAQAAAFGVPKDKWVYVWGAAGTQDSTDYLFRPVYYTSPSISATLDAALEAAGVSNDQIDAYDIYSCFPIVPKFAAKHLGIPVTESKGRAKPLSIIGGLTSFGGAGNNYSMHALTEMVRQIRSGTYQIGCVLANGGIATYHHAAVIASKPRPDANVVPFKSGNLPELLLSEHPVVTEHPATGTATIETYTVEYDRSGNGTRAFIIGRLDATGERFLANEDGPETLRWLEHDPEPIGKKGVVRALPGKDINVFKVDARAML